MLVPSRIWGCAPAAVAAPRHYPWRPNDGSRDLRPRDGEQASRGRHARALAAGSLRAMIRSRKSTSPPNAGLDLGTLGASVDSVYWADVLYATPETDVSGYERRRRTDVDRRRSGGQQSGCDREGRDKRPVARGAFARRGSLRATARGAAALRDRRRLARCRLQRGSPLRRSSASRCPTSSSGPLMEMLLRDVHHYFFNTEISPRPGASYRSSRRAAAALSRACDRPC